MKLLLLLAAAAPLFAQCTYSVSQTQFNVGAGTPTGSLTGSVAVTAGPGCAWSAQSQVSWIQVNTGQTGTGNGSVSWSIDRNPVADPRTGTLVVAGQTIIVTQAGAVCDYAISPAAANVPVSGATGSFQVKTSCLWGVGISNLTPWVTVPANTGGTADGTVRYTVAANACVAGRSAAILAGLGTQFQQFQIAQDGSPNNLSLSPASLTIPADATTGKVDIITGTGCAWSAFSDVSWLIITSSASGSGKASLGFRTVANPSSTRSGTLHIGPQLFVVTQLAVAVPAPQITDVKNAASFQTGVVSPGEIVSIFGTNMGPVKGVPLQVSDDGKSITTTLGGVQVLFDGTPAALTYAGATQINAVVPYAVAGNSSTQVQVQYQGASSPSMTLQVQAATPGLFTLDATGGGPGAILNQDYSVNGTGNRAARGSVVQIYCTGGGVTDPASMDAALTGTPLPMLTQPVSVTIGGVSAAIAYSGGAPTAVAGLTQINAVVPDSVAPGPALPVLVKIGNWQSQAGVTVAIK